MHMNTSTLLIVAIASVFNFIILYLIVQSATRSKQISEIQEHQLKVLIEIALASGVDEEKIIAPLSYYGSTVIRKAQKLFYDGKLPHSDFEKLKQKYTY